MLIILKSAVKTSNVKLWVYVKSHVCGCGFTVPVMYTVSQKSAYLFMF